jgi:hypothetical protein
MRQISDTVHAPRPKKKIKKPGSTSSSRNNTSPRINQNSSGLDKMFAIIV